MAFTYTDDPANVPRDAVRLLVGDTDADDAKLSDSEISYFLGQADEEAYGAAAIAARAIAAKFAAEVSSSFDAVRGIRADFGALSKKYMDLAVRLESQAKKYGRKGGFGAPLAGGISVSAVESAEKLSDRNPTEFKVGMFDYYATDSLTGEGS